VKVKSSSIAVSQSTAVSQVTEECPPSVLDKHIQTKLPYNSEVQQNGQLIA
jgi:hypothetical protein